MLATERFITELLTARKGTDSKRWWESQGLWAIVGSLVVGLSTILGNYVIQDKQKTRDFALARLDFELKRNREFFAETAGLVGRVLTAAEDQLTIAEGKLDDSLAERKQVVDQVNVTDREWRVAQTSVAFFFQLYYGSNDALPVAWANASQALNAAWRCSEGVYYEHLQAKAPSSACAAELEAARVKWQAIALPLAEDYAKRLKAAP